MSWRASWIWLQPQPKMDNLYVYARSEFALKSVGATALARISASQLYKLYVNGEYVGRGPNPADPKHYYYDCHDIARFLKPGRNVIAVIAYTYTVELADAGAIKQNWGRGGILFEADLGGVMVTSDASWKVIQAPPWDQDAAINCNLYNDYKEHYDTRKEVGGWMLPGFDDGRWSAPLVIGTPPAAPWTKLLPREIPLLGGEVRTPVEAYWESASVTYAWRKDWEVYHEQRLIDPHYRKDKWTEVTKTHDDFTPSILLDFGTLVTGYVRIVVHDSGGGIIDLSYGESLNITRVDRFILRGGEQALEPYNRRTFRYMRLSFPETPRRIDLESVTLRMDTYPVEPAGEFACDDELVNRIWQVSTHTIRLSMLDHFVDCPWRERTIYGGDVYVENPIAYYAFGDQRLNRKTLRQMFALQFPEGALPPFGPYDGINSFYPAWSAYFGLAVIDDWRLTADVAFLQEIWPSLVRLCDWTVRSSGVNALPLIGYPEAGQGGTFPKYDQAKKAGYASWEVYPFCALMLRASALARERGHAAEAERWGGCGERMVGAIRANLVAAATGLAHPYPRAANPAFNQNDSTLLLWSEALPASDAERTIRHLLAPGAAVPIDTPFFGFFMLEGLFRHGHDRDALEFMRRYWGAMLERGATTFWEHFSLGYRKTELFGRGASACHGWSAAPAQALPAFVLGVEPSEAGFRRILVRPQPGGLSWARGAVPTPHGPVKVDWQRSSDRFRLSCTLPRPGRIEMPRSHQHLARYRLDGAEVSAAPGAPAGFDVQPGTHVLESLPR